MQPISFLSLVRRRATSPLFIILVNKHVNKLIHVNNSCKYPQAEFIHTVHVCISVVYTRMHIHTRALHTAP